MNLINMKVEMKKDLDSESPMPMAEPPEYPFGLRLCLKDEDLEKLGIGELPKIGSPMMLMARVAVCSVSQYENIDQKSHRSVELQITDMAVSGEKQELSASEKLYGAS